MTLLPCRAALLALALAATPTSAQSPYPRSRSSWWCPFPAGSLVDMLGRSMGEALTTTLKQPVIVDNKPGASTLIGAKAVASAPSRTATRC